VYSSREEIEKFLDDVRKAIRAGKVTLVDRYKNMNTLAEMGLTLRQVYREICELTFVNYETGPEIDRDFPESDMLWIFKTNIDHNSIYIKIKVEYRVNGDVKIISFHFDGA